jgi:hypothetical protein
MLPVFDNPVPLINWPDLKNNTQLIGSTPSVPVSGLEQYQEVFAFKLPSSTEKAGLTQEEAAKFFPVYFELQDRKKQLNDEAWKLLRSGKDEKTTDTQYGEILEGVYDARIASDRLDKTYFEKFKKILSCKKIYLVQRAEMRFHRELLKGVRDNKGGNERPQGKRK